MLTPTKAVLVCFQDADGPKGGMRWVVMLVDRPRWEAGEVCGWVTQRARTLRSLLARHPDAVEVWRTRLARVEGRTDSYQIR